MGSPLHVHYREDEWPPAGVEPPDAAVTMAAQPNYGIDISAVRASRPSSDH